MGKASDFRVTVNDAAGGAEPFGHWGLPIAISAWVFFLCHTSSLAIKVLQGKGRPQLLSNYVIASIRLAQV